MLTSPSTRPSAHLDFLPDSSQGASSSSVAVSTRLISGYVSPNAPRRQPISSTLDNPAQAIVPSKRKSSASASLPSKMQTLDARPKLKRGSSSDRSRGSSRQHSPAPLQQPIYRFNKSRSPSAFQISESRIPRLHWIEEDGTPGDRFLSCESVVHTLMHSYKSCTIFCVPTLILSTHSALDFKNPKDPNDTSFEPHPTAYPTSELEYPNTGGCET
jgi:H3 lysine-79-specific histone-lysine N-methyltransferase